MTKRIATVSLWIVLGLAMSASPAMAVSSYLTAFQNLYPSSTTGTTAWSTSGARCNVCHSSGAGTNLNGYGSAFARQPHGSSTAVTTALQAIAGVNSDGDPAVATNLAEVNVNAQPGWRSGANNTLYSLSSPTTVASTGVSPPTTLVGSADPAATTNQRPVLATIPSQQGIENTLLTFQAGATDDGPASALNFSLSNAPTGATLTNNGNGTATFNWTPTFTQAGSWSPIVTVTDAGSPVQSAQQTVSITIGDVNRPPVLGAIANQTANEGQALPSLTISATDPDGDTFSFALSNAPTGATLTNNGNGTATFNWTPTFTQAGSYSPTVTVTDTGSPARSASASFTITVNNVNQPPVLSTIGSRTVSEGQTLTFTATATDPDGSALTFSGANLPAGVTVSTSGTFSWTPSFTQAGNYSVTVIVTDTGGLTDQETFTITVGDVNRPPVLNTIGNRTVNAGQLLTFTITASDPDGDVLSFAATGLPAGASLVDNHNGTATFSWTPTTAGNYPVTITVTDAGTPPLSDPETFTITVGSVNRPPVLAPIGNRTVNAGQLLTFSITASDPDGGALSFAATGLPAGATLVDNHNGTATFNWTPSSTQVNSYSVTVTVSDAGTPLLTDSETFTITVNAVNQAPVVTNPGNKTVNEGVLLAFTIVASDPDGNTLTFTSANLPAGATLNATSGAFAWTPTFTQTGAYSVTVTVTDNGSPALSASTSFTITVNNVNRAPVVTNPGNKTVTAGQLLAFTITASDPDGNAVTFAATGLPAGATLNATTGAFSWTPTTSQAGSYSVTVTATDNGVPPLTSGPQTFTITVSTTVNRAPLLTNPGNKTVNEGQLLAFTIVASDPDGNALTFSSASLPAGATLNATSGAFAWTPSFTQAGSYPVTVTVTDNGSPPLSASQTFTITVVNVNGAPVLTNPGSRTATEGQLLAFTITASDPDGNALTYASANLPPGATLNVTTGAFSWTPATGQAGSYSVTVTVTDNGSPPLSASQTFTIVVQAPTSFSGINVLALHDRISRKYNRNCTDCHASVLTEQSLDPAIHTAHVVMRPYVPGTEDNVKCAFCHRTVNWQVQALGSLRKSVDARLCRLCHGPEGPGLQFYQAGLSLDKLNGAGFYGLLCEGCHRALAQSQVGGKSASDIQKAIAENRGGMAPFVVLTPQEIQAIANALATVRDDD